MGLVGTALAVLSADVLAPWLYYDAWNIHCDVSTVVWVDASSICSRIGDISYDEAFSVVL